MGKRVITKRIGEVLLERGVIDRRQLEEALQRQKAGNSLLGDVLVEMGYATEEAIALALTAQYGFPYLPLDNYEIDHGLTEVIPEQLARRYCLIPIDRIGNALTLAMADPTNVQAIEDVELLTKCMVQTFVSTPSDIGKAINRHYKKHHTNGPTGGAPARPA